MPDTIETLSGPKRVRDLGTVMPHDHLFVDTRNQYAPRDMEGLDGEHGLVSYKNIGALRRNCYLMKDNLYLDDAGTAAYEVGCFMKAGGATIVELTPIGVGRDPRRLAELSASTGLNIVMGTGVYTDDAMPADLRAMDAEGLAEFFVSELTEGVASDCPNGAKAPYKAGVIGEIGTSERILPSEERSLRAAAIASKETGAPIYVHIYPWCTEGERALDIIGEHGVEPNRVCVCHVDVRFDRGYMLRLLRRGAYLGFDNFGKEFYIVRKPGEFAGGAFATDVERVRAAMDMCERGYAGRLLFSTDIALKILLRSYGGWGYGHILTNVVPIMADMGMGDGDIKAIIHQNPMDFLTGR